MFIIVFDFSFNDITVIRDIVNKYGDNKSKLDFREDLVLQFQQIIEPLLLSSLGERICGLCFNVFQESVNIEKTQEPCCNVLIGLKLNPLKANVVVERGPTANLPEVIFHKIFFNIN